MLPVGSSSVWRGDWAEHKWRRVTPCGWCPKTIFKHYRPLTAEGPHSSDEEDEEDLEEQQENPGQQQEQLADDQAEQVPQEEEAHLEEQQQIPEEEQDPSQEQQEEQPGANHAKEMPELAAACVLDFVPVLPAPSASPTARVQHQRMFQAEECFHQIQHRMKTPILTPSMTTPPATPLDVYKGLPKDVIIALARNPAPDSKPLLGTTQPNIPNPYVTACRLKAENAGKTKVAGNAGATAGDAGATAGNAGAIGGNGAMAGNAGAIGGGGNAAAATTVPRSDEGVLAAELLQKKACVPSNVTLTHKKAARGGLSASASPTKNPVGLRAKTTANWKIGASRPTSAVADKAHDQLNVSDGPSALIDDDTAVGSGEMWEPDAQVHHKSGDTTRKSEGRGRACRAEMKHQHKRKRSVSLGLPRRAVESVHTMDVERQAAQTLLALRKPPVGLASLSQKKAEEDATRKCTKASQTQV